MHQEVIIPDSGTTAIVLALSGADAFLDVARGVAAELVRPLPPHVSVLYPGPDPDDKTLADVGALSRHVPSDAELSHLMIGDDGFVGVAVPALDDVLRLYRARWPFLLPYNGRYGAEPAAHMTLALGVDSARATRIAQAVEEMLPQRVQPHGPYVAQYIDSDWRLLTTPK